MLVNALVDLQGRTDVLIRRRQESMRRGESVRSTGGHKHPHTYTHTHTQEREREGGVSCMEVGWHVHLCAAKCLLLYSSCLDSTVHNVCTTGCSPCVCLVGWLPGYHSV